MTPEAANIFLTDDLAILSFLDRKTIRHWSAVLRGQSHWIEIVPGMDSLTVKFDPLSTDISTVPELLVQQLGSGRASRVDKQTRINIPICYDRQFGLDQPEVAEILGVSTDTLADWHSSVSYDVAMLGFMPGFAYLECDIERPDIPRLATPRQQVAAGSVGVLGIQTGIYPFSGPGGWPVIGRTPCKLFDGSNSPPNLLNMGQAVSFTPISMAEFADLESGRTAWR